MPAEAAVPSLAQWVAPVSWRVVDFISDLHLSEDTPRTFEAWCRYMRTTDADAIIILGDLFDVWVGDDARHSDFEARCVYALRAASLSRSVGFMVGNRDFLVGPDMAAACGWAPLSDPTVLVLHGQRLMLSHGDELCIDDVEYQQFRQLVRGPSWQSDFLALPLAERRRQALDMRLKSQQRQRALPPDRWCDIDPGLAVRWMKAAQANVLIHGHTHRPASHSLALNLARHVLSDWDMDHAGIRRAEALRWRDGTLSRVSLVP